MRIESLDGRRCEAVQPLINQEGLTGRWGGPGSETTEAAPWPPLRRAAATWTRPAFGTFANITWVGLDERSGRACDATAKGCCRKNVLGVATEVVLLGGVCSQIEQAPGLTREGRDWLASARRTNVIGTRLHHGARQPQRHLWGVKDGKSV
jgi:hypothetical protein